MSVVSTLLRIKGSSLLCTKLLILARLFHKVLQQHLDTTPLVDTLGSKLGNLRRQLLRQIDQRLSSYGKEINEVVEDLTAYCLATSSSPSNALTHVHQLRANAIQASQGFARSALKGCIQARLALFYATIRQSRGIFPDLLGASLRTQGSRAVLDDEKVRQIEELKLDIHTRWFDDDIQNYTPWTRHDELQRNAASRQIQSWAGEALDLLIKSIEQDLSKEDDVHKVVEVRQGVLQTWLSSRATLRGLPLKDALQKLRLPFMRRCLELVETVAVSMQDSLESVTIGRLKDWDVEDASKALQSAWDAKLSSSDLTDGGRSFRQAIIDRHMGKTDDVSEVIARCEQYAEKIANIYATLKAMRETRWDDDYDEAGDEDDNDDEDKSTDSNQGPSIQGMHEILSRQDSTSLLENLSNRVRRMTQSLESKMPVDGQSTESSSSSSSSPDIFLLRSLRVLRERLPKLLVAINAGKSIDIFAQQAVSSLHHRLAVSVTHAMASSDKNWTDIMLSKPLYTRALWEGNPPLPLQISPGLFKFLRQLVKHMGDMGVDIWIPQAVDVLKEKLRIVVADDCHNALERAEAKAQQDREETKSQIDGSAEEANKENNDDSTERSEQQDGGDDKDEDEDENDDKNNNEQNDNPDSDHATNTANDAIAPQNDTEVSASPSPAPDSQPTQDHFLQLLFDLLYLQQAFQPSPPSHNPTKTTIDPPAEFARLVRQLEQRTEVDSRADVKGRLQKNAREYWRRTYLLFGVLCN